MDFDCEIMELIGQFSRHLKHLFNSIGDSIKCCDDIYTGIVKRKDMFGAALAVDNNNGSLYSCARWRITKGQREDEIN